MIPEKGFSTVLTLARDHLWTAEQTIRSTSTIQRYKISQGWVGWGCFGETTTFFVAHKGYIRLDYYR